MNLRNWCKKGFAKGNAKKWIFILGIITGLVLLVSFNGVMDYTSTNEFCMVCHFHPHAEQSWRLSTHHNNSSGNIVNCVECHLPPKGHGYVFAKAKTGLKDAYGYLFKDSADIDWDAKSQVDYAKKIVYETSCLKCHENLFPVTLSVDGSNAHLFYVSGADDQSCLNCHLNVGHYDRNAIHDHDSTFGVTVTGEEIIFAEATKVERFESFTEQIPGSGVTFDMVAIPGGTFKMGSPEDELFREEDEGPQRQVTMSPFWMAKVEVTWDEYLAFFRATSSQGRTEGKVVANQDVDAISGATPPWGAPDQGWGKGQRPAITMSWHAATVYCQWLSKVTGKKYRLPTEAEWEYAARGGTETPYFFEADPKKVTNDGFLKKIFKADTAVIASYAIYMNNNKAKTEEPSAVKENPFGLKNMLGNVSEFCLDYYASTAYQTDTTNINPAGPRKGSEHVVRGGSFKSDAKDLRVANRDYTKTQAWLVTDPQIPKSIWWYSDVIDVGFRVVCEPDSSIQGL